MAARIVRGCEVDRKLESMGWRRTRRQRLSKHKQPEVWKLRKWWLPKRELIPRELIVRIVRHDTLYRAEVVRVRHVLEWTADGESPSRVYWQPLRDVDRECPLALAVFLHIEGDGDPVLAAYREAKPYKLEDEDWIEAPLAQMPGRRNQLRTMWDESESFKDLQARARSRTWRSGQSVQVQNVPIPSTNDSWVKDMYTRKANGISGE